jgi:hypothetical protein
MSVLLLGGKVSRENWSWTLGHCRQCAVLSGAIYQAIVMWASDRLPAEAMKKWSSTLGLFSKNMPQMQSPFLI